MDFNDHYTTKEKLIQERNASSEEGITRIRDLKEARISRKRLGVSIPIVSAVIICLNCYLLWAAPFRDVLTLAWLISTNAGSFTLLGLIASWAFRKN